MLQDFPVYEHAERIKVRSEERKRVRIYLVAYVLIALLAFGITVLFGSLTGTGVHWLVFHWWLWGFA